MSRRAVRQRNVVPFRRLWAPRSRPPSPRRRGRFSNLPLAGVRSYCIAVGVVLALPNVIDVASSARGAQTGCRLVKVIDGDTATLACDGVGVVKARFVGFDAPELFSPGCLAEWTAAQAATLELRRLIWTADRREYRLAGLDRYDRRLVDLTLDGRPLAERMVASGHARRYAGGTRSGWCATEKGPSWRHDLDRWLPALFS